MRQHYKELRDRLKFFKVDQTTLKNIVKTCSEISIVRSALFKIEDDLFLKDCYFKYSLSDYKLDIFKKISSVEIKKEILKESRKIYLSEFQFSYDNFLKEDRALLIHCLTKIDSEFNFRRCIWVLKTREELELLKKELAKELSMENSFIRGGRIYDVEMAIKKTPNCVDFIFED